MKKQLEIYSEYFFKDREGKISSFLKEDVYNKIDPFDLSTFIEILKELNYPYFEKEYLWTLRHALELQKNNIKTTFGKYINKMNLASFKQYNFKDSIYDKNNIAKYDIIFTKGGKNII